MQSSGVDAGICEQHHTFADGLYVFAQHTTTIGLILLLAWTALLMYRLAKHP
jgi:hypothetical protein